MTAVKERFTQILPQIQRDYLKMPDSDVQQIINVWVQVKPKEETEEPFERQLGLGDGKYKTPDDINAYDNEIQADFTSAKPVRNEVRIGVAEGKFKAPDDFDANNEEVYAMIEGYALS